MPSVFRKVFVEFGHDRLEFPDIETAEALFTELGAETVLLMTVDSYPIGG